MWKLKLRLWFEYAKVYTVEFLRYECDFDTCCRR